MSFIASLVHQTYAGLDIVGHADALLLFALASRLLLGQGQGLRFVLGLLTFAIVATSSSSSTATVAPQLETRRGRRRIVVGTIADGIEDAHHKAAGSVHHLAVLKIWYGET